MTDLVTGNQIDVAAFDAGVSSNKVEKSKMLSPTMFPEEKFTESGESYYYTRTLSDGTEEPITSKNWSLKDLAYPLNVPFGGKRQGGPEDWTFTNWLVNQAPTQLAPVINTVRGLKTIKNQNQLNKAKKTFMNVDEDLNIKDAKNVTPNQSQVSGTTTKGNLQSKEGALQTRISQFQAGSSKSTRDLGLTTEYAKDMRLGIVPASKQRQDYIKWDKGALKYYEKTGSMKGYRNYTDPATGLEYRKGMESGKLKNIGLAGRRERGARRNKTTKIDKDRVAQLMEKYNQPPEMVGEFLEYQRVRKKSLDDTIKKINERIKKNPHLYLDEDGKVLKASLGHGKAAKGYTDSADVITNIDIENYRRNVKRSNLDEVSDEFNRGLGRSIDLEEEILKFLDKDLRDFHRTGGGLKLGRHQQDRIIDYVKRHKDADIDWKSEKSPSGKQLFKSKEEFLQNEATQLFRGDKHGQTMYDLKSRGF